MKKEKRLVWRGFLILVSFVLTVCLLSACGLRDDATANTDVSLVAIPREESPSPSEETALSTPPSSPAASANTAIPLRQMLIAADASEDDPTRKAALEALAQAKADSKAFPDYSSLFPLLEPEDRLQLLLLADQYVYENQRPSQLLSLAGGDDDIYYDADSASYHIPSRAITQEELLMLLDWEMQANHLHLNASLSRLPDDYDLGQEDALVGKALRLVQSTYNVEIGDAEYYLRHYSIGESSYWQLFFFRSSANTLSYAGQPCEWYQVEFTAPEGAFFQMERGFTDCTTASGLPQPNATPLKMSDFTLDTLKQDGYWIEDAREIVEELIQPISEIQDVFLNRFDGDDQLILRVAMVDQSAYRITYSVISRLPNEITYIAPEELLLDPILYPPETQEMKDLGQEEIAAEGDAVETAVDQSNVPLDKEETETLRSAASAEDIADR